MFTYYPLSSVLPLNSHDFQNIIFDKYLPTEYDMRKQGRHAYQSFPESPKREGARVS